MLGGSKSVAQKANSYLAGMEMKTHTIVVPPVGILAMVVRTIKALFILLFHGILITVEYGFKLLGSIFNLLSENTDTNAKPGKTASTGSPSDRSYFDYSYADPAPVNSSGEIVM